MTATVGSYLFLLLLALGVWRAALWRWPVGWRAQFEPGYTARRAA